MDRRAGQQIAGILHLCLPSAGTAGAYRHTWLLMWVPGIQTQDLMLSCQELHELPSSLGPECPYFLGGRALVLLFVHMLLKPEPGLHTR